MPRQSAHLHARARSSLLVFITASLTSCGLAARQHPCWDYVSQHMHGEVPEDVASTMAWDRGAERSVRGTRAPVGYYWKRMTSTLNMQHMRQYLDGHELTACPAASAPPVTTPDRPS